MSNNSDFLNDLFSTFWNTSDYKDYSMMEIMGRRKEFEQNLDTMWAIYSKGCPQQIVEYQKGLEQIKRTGLKVLRNSQGQHKIVVPK